MSKLQDCADVIIGRIKYNSCEDCIKIECELSRLFEVMLIFLDYEDMIDILKNRVIPNLSKTKEKVYHDFFKNQINYWNECLEFNED